MQYCIQHYTLSNTHAYNSTGVEIHTHTDHASLPSVDNHTEPSTTAQVSMQLYTFSVHRVTKTIYTPSKAVQKAWQEGRGQHPFYLKAITFPS